MQLFKIKNPQYSPVVRFVFPAFIVAVILFLDHVTKVATLENLAGSPTLVLIPGILGLQYVENTGMAFGMFANATELLIAFRIIGMVVIALFIVFFDIQHLLGFISFAMVLGGGIGNIIDGFRYGFVVDMIKTLFVDFPVFNFADCFITVGEFVLIGYLLWDIFRDFKKGRSETDGITQDF